MGEPEVAGEGSARGASGKNPSLVPLGNGWKKRERMLRAEEKKAATRFEPEQGESTPPPCICSAYVSSHSQTPGSALSSLRPSMGPPLAAAVN